MESALNALAHVTTETVRWYVYEDKPERTSYMQYNWDPEKPDESIWVVDGADAVPVDEYAGSRVIDGLKHTRYFPRLIVPPQVRDQLRGLV